MKLWTVIGIWDDGVVLTRKVMAEGAYDAMARTARKTPRTWRGSLQILGAILAGQNGILPACDDSGRAACAIDVADL